MRLRFLAATLVCALLLGYGYYLQFGPQGLEPCPLCQVQRGFYYLVGITCVIAAIHARWFPFYGVLAALFALGGASVAGRQVWLQHLPADKVPACGPDLAFMFKNLPLSNAIQKLFAGSGECAVVDWTFLGLSIAEWSLLLFLALAGYALWLAFSGRRRAAARA